MFLDGLSIKKMIILNGLLILSISGGATVFNIVTTTLLQSKLSHLTKQSTPFQVKTIHAQALIQEATTVMTKMIMSSTIKDLDEQMSIMGKVLSELKKVSNELTVLSMGDNRIEKMTDEFEKTTGIVYSATKEKIEAESNSKDASKKMSQKVGEIAKKLQEIDLKIKGIQKGASEKLNSAASTL